MKTSAILRLAAEQIGDKRVWTHPHDLSSYPCPWRASACWAIAAALDPHLFERLQSNNERVNLDTFAKMRSYENAMRYLQLFEPPGECVPAYWWENDNDPRILALLMAADIAESGLD
jgi:hypothetical protein